MDSPIIKKKMDGINWFFTNKQNSRFQLDIRGGITPTNWKDERASEHRWKAGNIVRRSRVEIAEVDLNLLKLRAKAYQETTEEMAIILENMETGEKKALDYITRFSEERLGLQFKRIKTAWENATDKHTRGVFLTLTTSPNTYKMVEKANGGLSSDLKNMRDGDTIIKIGGFNSHFSSAKSLKKSMDTFLKRLFREERSTHRKTTEKKRTWGKKDYIAVMEYSSKGLPHIHMVIFGTKWLAYKTQLSTWWGETGQGKIIRAHAIEKLRGKWYWDGSRPKNTKRSPNDYMLKEIAKSIWNTKEQVLHWANNTKSYSGTRGLFDTKEKSILEQVMEKKELDTTQWKWIGVMSWDDVLQDETITIPPDT